MNSLPAERFDSTQSREAFLAEIDRLLALDFDETLGGRLASAARPIALAPSAKRGRPTLLFELGRLVDVAPEALVEPAVMVELMHLASLLHDDVLDEAEVRRGLPSVNATMGNVRAVLVGDDVIVSAFSRVAEHPAVVRAGLRTLSMMVNAVAAEVAARGDVSLSIADWRSIALGKTAALFALCGELAGIAAGDEDAALSLAAGALHLGLAFQAADDLADLRSGEDLAARSPNVVLALAVAGSPKLALQVAAAWARGRVEVGERAAILREVFASPAPLRCQALIADELAEAERHLAPWACTPVRGRALDALRGWMRALTLIAQSASEPLTPGELG